MLRKGTSGTRASGRHSMPASGGLEACREIRDSSDVAIIMLTAAQPETDKVLLRSTRGRDYVVKPFRMAELLGADSRGPRPTSSGEPSPTYAFQ